MKLRQIAAVGTDMLALHLWQEDAEAFALLRIDDYWRIEELRAPPKEEGVTVLIPWEQIAVTGVFNAVIHLQCAGLLPPDQSATTLRQAFRCVLRGLSAPSRPADDVFQPAPIAQLAEWLGKLAVEGYGFPPREKRRPRSTRPSRPGAARRARAGLVVAQCLGGLRGAS
jgi:hypothetical protein